MMPTDAEWHYVMRHEHKALRRVDIADPSTVIIMILLFAIWHALKQTKAADV